MKQQHVSVGERIPNLAPMVDVIMVLLIFFLLGASVNLIREGVLQTQLDPNSGPGGGASVQITPTIKIGLEDVNKGEGVKIFVMDEPPIENDFERVYAYLETRRAAGADVMNPVVIGAEPGVHWKFVVKAMDAAVRAKFQNVQFAVSFKRGALGEAAP